MVRGLLREVLATGLCRCKGRFPKERNRRRSVWGIIGWAAGGRVAKDDEGVMFDCLRLPSNEEEDWIEVIGGYRVRAWLPAVFCPV